MPPSDLPPSLSLAGKVAIVTGSSRGIGRETALELARRGAAISILHAQAESIADEINALTKACIVKANLEDLDCGEKVIQGTLKGLACEKIDILVNNAAIGVAPLPATEFDLHHYQSVMDVNVRAPMLLVKNVLPVIAEKDGRIINISSGITKYPVVQRTSYAISKCALEGLTRQWATEIAGPYHLTVNTVTVGATETETSAARTAADPTVQKARAEIIARTTAAERLGTMDDIAQVVAWLASEGAR